MIVLHSDGISANWSFDRYRASRHAMPSLIAAVLLRDHGRGRDDATVLVMKERHDEGPLLSLSLEAEQDIVLARQKAREVARLVGFDGQAQTSIATAVSEIARNTVAVRRRRHAGLRARERAAHGSLLT